MAIGTNSRSGLASLCPIFPGLPDLSLVRYVHLVGQCRLPGIFLLDPSLSVGLIPMPLWSALVVSLQQLSRLGRQLANAEGELCTDSLSCRESSS